MTGISSAEGVLRFEPVQAARILAWMRVSAILGKLITILFVHFGFGLSLPLGPMLLIIAGLAAWNAVAFMRLHNSPEQITQYEVLFHLLIDVAALTALLGLAGGPSNPFVSLYLVPVTLATVAMPTRQAMVITVLCVLLYGLLLGIFLPMEEPHPVLGGDFNLHLIGMWVNFVIAAWMITVFVRFMASVLRRQDLRLSRARESTLRNEQIVALGTVAAGAAHQLGTPLSTMSMVIEELRNERRDDETLQQDLELLGSQLAVCKETLEDLKDAGAAGSDQGGRTVSLRQHVARIIDTWRLMHPKIQPMVEYEEPFIDVQISQDPTLMHALLNLLNNAAEASVDNGRSGVEVAITSDGKLLTLTIDDEGTGLDSDRVRHAGRVIQTTKPSGMGIGLVLANATVDRFGGRVTLMDSPEGEGARTRIELPLEKLVAGSAGTSGAMARW
ncbi:HAMP domain-containing histidine kinase [Halorhodospira halochloris]|uniref:histidine kinase n=1 Tax=Halorhodospira halochloris TaxID=1052 RepID=A0A0X8X9F2_HALHR|nr:ATP-binding protein [Halorhodospira halochloris]MBK1651224.1 two-component sensor histidine kinase [Halorhodospira halochloris]MCG5530738.1 HAMP domain-containing histidine kinase [Halorhodospira halochloris]MCG5547631.1 HAMP domain-containing histidine kinase [Halorhodospira halochloris]BAU57497.1 sensor histidine kinase PrrB [Halorhodospira halochloris]